MRRQAGRAASSTRTWPRRSWPPPAAVAAAYLSDVGAERDLPQGLYRYNRSWSYVDDVLAKAAEYDATGAIPRDCTGQQPQLVSHTEADPQAVIDNLNVGLDSRAAADLPYPRMDTRASRSFRPSPSNAAWPSRS